MAEPKKGFGRRFVRFLLKLIVFILALFALFLAFLTISEFKPAPSESVDVAGHAAKKAATGEEMRIVTWNTGYGALGDNADFFMDGGKLVKTATNARVEENVNGMIDILREIAPDIIFLQEVDRNSSRSYKINEADRYAEAFPSMRNAFATNYRVAFVPYPVPPIGKVDSGIMTLSSYETLAESERVALPCPFSWPVRLGNLKRCLLVTRVPVEGTDKELVLINLHLEAYDSGEGKAAQTAMFRDYLMAEIEKGNYVIAGGDFNQVFSNVDTSAYPEQEGKWHAGLIDTAEFPDSLQFLMDPGVPTCRSLDQPYRGADTAAFQYYMIDGFIVSGNVTVSRLKTLAEGFVQTDHNPVMLEFVLE